MSERQGLVFAYDFHFRLQSDAAFMKGGVFDLGHEVEDFAGGGAALVDDEVGVDVADDGFADAAAFEGEFVDEFLRRRFRGS